MSTARDPEGSAAEAFAHRLRELREQSGRSYGSLARRIGVSASTLHRYCSGATVPAEFAPVERLARFCGRSGGELVALHHAWVLADAERTRRQEAATARGAEPAPPGAPEPGATGAAGPAGDGGGDTGTGPGAGGRTAGGTAPGPAGGTGTESGPAPRETTGTGTFPATDTGNDRRTGAYDGAGSGPAARSGAVAPGPATGSSSGRTPGPVTRSGGATSTGTAAEAAETVVLGGGGPRSGPRSPIRPPARRAAYAAGLVALAVSLVVGLVAYGNSPDRPAAAARPESGEPVRRGEQAGGGEGAASTTRPPASPSTSAAAGPSRPAGSPSTGSARPPRGGSPDPKDGGPVTPPAVPVAGAPFTVATDHHQWAYGCGHEYLVGRGPSAVPPPPVEADAPAWAGALGAVHGGETRVRITVQGTGEQAVVLHSLQVRTAARREPPRTGNVYRMDQGCGGVLTPRAFEVDLDRRRPLARSVPGHGENGPIPAVSFPYRVSVRDPEVLLVTAESARCDCDWYLELEWSSGGRRGVVRVDDDGRPFRTSAITGRPVYDYDPGARRWVAAAPAGADAARPEEG
ncbi:helix-turn-helix domain-containing protein [Streptomyces sp. NPDC003691]